MKKFLSIIALMLALLMVAAPMVAAEEADAAPVEGEEAETASAWTAPTGIKIYYAENVEGKAPLLDGTISEGEYGKAYRITDPVPVNNYGANHQDLTAEPVADPTAVSEYVDLYFAYDENNVYIAIYEMGPKAIEGNENLVPARANWVFNFGFDLNDLSSYFQMQGYKTNVQWAKDEFSYFEFGKKNSSPIAAYDLISEAVVKKTDVVKGEDIAFGDLLSSNGNANYADGQCAMTMEFKFEKAVVAQAMNACFFTDYDTISDAMYFSLSTNQYQRNADVASQYYKWAGNTDIRQILIDNPAAYTDFGIYEGSTREFLFDLIVFGDENTEIKIADPFPVRPETEPEETEPEVTEPEVTEAPADETEAPAGETEAPADEGGCGGTVAVAGIALVAALGTCTAFVAKKKED